MPSVQIYNQEAKPVGEIDLSDVVFAAKIKEHLFQEIVTWQLAKRRSGSASVKGRTDIHGSGAKPYKQKGTGRARRGTMRKSPILRGGPVAHGPSPKSWGYRPPRKVRTAALRSALTKRLSESRLFVIDDLAIGEYRTRKVLEILGRFELKGALLIDGPNDHLARSSKNLPNCTFLRVDGLNVFDVLRHDALLISTDAIKAAEERLAK
jgi:large subunit ribosomal protein L4